MYDAVKWLHLASLISWFAGLFYLPRLFVYHADAAPGSELSETLKTMERKLLKIIMNPAMILTWITGLTLMILGGWAGAGWLHAKLLLVLVLTGFHGFCGRWRKTFEADANTRDHRFFRKINEIPTVLMLLILAMAVFRPF